MDRAHKYQAAQPVLQIYVRIYRKVKIQRIFGVDDNSISILYMKIGFSAHDNPNSWMKLTFRMDTLMLYTKSYVHAML